MYSIEMSVEQKAEELILKFGNIDTALMCVDEIFFCDAIFHANNKETVDEKLYWIRVKERLLSKQ